MQVARLFRHPVKSVSGEELDAVEVDARGMAGDRVWALYTDDGGIGSGKNSTRFRKVDGLLQWASELPGTGAPVLVAPDGRRVAVDSPDATAVLRAEFGRELTPRPETGVVHFDDAPLHLVTTSSLRTLGAEAGGEVAVRRTRANVLVDTGDAEGWVEDDWLGREITLGDVVVRVTAPMPRCVMVDMSHRGVDGDVKILKPLGRTHAVELGVMAEVVRPGRLAVGDAVTVR
ncbi:MOSC domain-containing protein [Jatrophihabitans sp. YIM 134969]